jgi:ATP-binding cassette subfamily E protein 1
MVRVAVLDPDKCRPKQCDNVCIRFCPKVRGRIEAIRLEGEKPVIVEALCSGCGICIKKCPFNAISIVNLPDELEEEASHRFSANSFKLFRLPMPSPGVVLGLVGQNGIGKTTAINILSGEIKLNLSRYDNPPEWPEIIRHYRGSQLQDYFQKFSEKHLKIVHKPQYVDKIPKIIRGKVHTVLEKVNERDKLKAIAERLELDAVWNRNLDVLSGGELQRVAVAATICREADVYLFDEPSSYLDVKQRLEVARTIRELTSDGKTVIVSEHDLAIIDYLSDQICIFYGIPGVYGIVSHVHGVRVGINIYLQGFIPDENMRFRKEPIEFHVKPPASERSAGQILVKWENMKKSYKGFKLEAEAGEAREGEVVGILGPNGIGKTTFVKLLSRLEKPDKGLPAMMYELQVSYKPQYISAEFEGTVEELIRSVAKDQFSTGWYETEILNPLNLRPLLDRKVTELSGGELQRVTIGACLSRTAQLYLIDEPSAYLDVEERLIMARTIRRVIENRNVTAFVVEHDVVAQDFIADRLMVFKGEPGVNGQASQPVTLRKGMNVFLKEMGITFRRDATTKRPRVNKENSQMDKHQKEMGEYYYIDTSKD